MTTQTALESSNEKQQQTPGSTLTSVDPAALDTSETMPEEVTPNPSSDDEKEDTTQMASGQDQPPEHETPSVAAPVADPNTAASATQEEKPEQQNEAEEQPSQSHPEHAPKAERSSSTSSLTKDPPFATPPAEESWASITERDVQQSVETSFKVVQHAQRVLDQRVSEASPDQLDIFRFETALPRFWNSELVLDAKLAHGNFADIYTIRSYAESQTAKTDEDAPPALQLMKSCPANNLVIKVLRPQLLANPRLFATGAADLIVEGTILAAMRDHPHIQNIQARSVPSVEGYASGRRDAFFLVFERLQETLEYKLLNEWTPRSRQSGLVIPGRRDSRAQLLKERLHVMAQLADAMAHLHSKRVIHRDLKLSNIGMDIDGNVKLLDFGLARVLPSEANDEITGIIANRASYLMTTNTGSPRYMAPEIVRGEKYNQQADIYSFAILLHEVLSMSKAWKGLKPNDIYDKVAVRHQRPPISMFWPVAIRELLRQTWSDVPSARLPMEHVQTILKKQSAMSGGEHK